MNPGGSVSAQQTGDSNNLVAIDGFRLIAAILVVAIHTSPLLGLSEAADFTLTRIIGRVAVPFFFMVSGYFLFAKAPLGQLPTAHLYRFLRKTAMVYGIAIVCYLPLNLYSGTWRQWHDPRALVQDLVFDGTLYHLWYLPAAMLGTVLVHLLLRYLRTGGACIIAVLLYLLGLFGDSYYGWSEQQPLVEAAYAFGFAHYDYTRNGLFMTPLFVWLGAVLSAWRHHQVLQAPRWMFSALALSMLLLLGEGWLLHSLDWQRHDSMYMLLPVVMFFLFACLLIYSNNGKNHGNSKLLMHATPQWRKMALLIYLIHPAVIVAVRMLAKASGTTSLFIDNLLLHFIAVSVISWLTSHGLLRVWPRLRQRVQTGQWLPSWAKSPLSLIIRRKEAHHQAALSVLGAHRAWVEIDLAHLRHNAVTLQAALPHGCRVMAVVKADAYGHGASAVAACLQQVGIRSFAVADLTEGLALRASGISGEILVLGYTSPEAAAEAAASRLTLTAVDADHAAALAQAGVGLRVQLKIDTGMHRLGEQADQSARIAEVFTHRHLAVTGIYTHLQAASAADDDSRAQTALQLQRFAQARSALAQRGITPPWHTHSSYGLLYHERQLAGSACARIGIALYGTWSTPNEAVATLDLRPVLSLRARICLIKHVAAGTSIGYGLQTVAPRAMRIALLPLGYADGIPRSLSNGRGYVLIHGQKSPIVGAVCMDQMIVDISDQPGVRQGDPATLIGRDEQTVLPAAHLAACAGTITNELLSRLGPRLPRIGIDTDKHRRD